jgi:serine protease AprX
LAGTTVCASAALAASPPSRLDATLAARAATASGRSRVIIQAADRDCLDRLLAAPDAFRGRRLELLGADVADVPDSSLLALARCASSIHADRPVTATLDSPSAVAGAPAIGRDLGLTGAGVGVAVIDSGVTGWHDDLTPRVAGSTAQRVVHFADFVNFQPTAYDDYGHGTHVAGIIAGNGYDSEGAHAGVAPDAAIVALKVLDGSGQGYISNVIAAIDYAVAHRQQYNIRVINLSVGAAVRERYDRDPLTLAARRAVEAGIVVVTAAGNVGRTAAGDIRSGGITAPGNAPWVLTVGASSDRGSAWRSDDVVAAFSSRGPTRLDRAAKPDVVAPGVGLVSLADAGSLFYTRHAASLRAGTVPTATLPYLSLSGTSTAAPVVSGTIALLVEANPALTPNAIKAILEYTAEARPGDDVLAQGAGFLNAAGAVRLARRFADPLAPTDLPLFDRLAGETIVWSRHLIWGNVRIAGGLITPAASGWAPDVTWGATSTAGGDPVVWGALLDDSLVWGERAGEDRVVWRGGVAEVWGGACGAPACDIVTSGSGTYENVVWSETCSGVDCADTTGGTDQDADGAIREVARAFTMFTMWTRVLMPGAKAVWG